MFLCLLYSHLSIITATSNFWVHWPISTRPKKMSTRWFISYISQNKYQQFARRGQAKQCPPTETECSLRSIVLHWNWQLTCQNVKSCPTHMQWQHRLPLCLSLLRGQVLNLGVLWEERFCREETVGNFSSEVGAELDRGYRKCGCVTCATHDLLVHALNTCFQVHFFFSLYVGYTMIL